MALPRTALLISAVDPNDPAASDTWTDFARTRMLRVKNAGRGRQYEIGQAVAGRMETDLLNIDEYLNPANASSPLLQTAKLMRRVRWMGVLPADGIGNLVNLSNIKADPSFESYTVGSGTSWLWFFGATAPQVVSAPVHSGTRAIQKAITAGAGLQGMVVELQFIPGDVYTASVWVNQSVANTVELSLNGHLAAPMTSTAATGWIKLVGTFTADQPTLQVCVVTRTPTLTGTLTIDEIQVEQGAVATAFTTSGPRIRGLWGGHVEKLPIAWEQGSNGYTGTAKLSAVGPLAAIAQIGVKTDWGSVMAAKKPDYWWPMWDGSNATTFAEVSGNNGPPLIRRDSTYGPASTWSPGSQTNVPGDPAGTGLLTDSGASVGANNAPCSVAQTGFPNSGPLINTPGVNNSSPWAFTTSWWMSYTIPPGISNGQHLAIMDPAFTRGMQATWSAKNSPTPDVFNGSFTSSNFARAGGDVNDLWGDGKPHLFVMTWAANGTGGTFTIYVDGQAVLIDTANNPSTWPYPETTGVVQIGAAFSPLTGGVSASGPTNATYAHLATWNRALTAQDVTDLWNAGKGYPGDTPGQRLSRLFGLYYVGPTVIDAGRTKLGPSGAVDGTKLGQLAQRIVDSEAGNLSENRDAALEFDGRDTRFLATVPQAVFGENVAGGEIPYRDTPVFGYDTVQLNNQATVTQASGTKANASDPTSIKSYYQRSIQVNTDAQSGLVAIDHANWLVANRGQPRQRVERITLDPGANPSIQAAVFDLELNQRYTLKRVARSGNSGAGVTMTGDFFLENINHRDYDPEKGTWLVDLILSPAPLQPWILGDPTWGQLGVTTVLGF